MNVIFSLNFRGHFMSITYGFPGGLVVRNLPANAGDTPKPKILTFPHGCFGEVSQSYLSAVSQAAVLILPQIKLNSQLSSCTSFFSQHLCLCLHCCPANRFISTIFLHFTPVFLPGKSHGQRGPVGYSSWGHKELDTF